MKRCKAIGLFLILTCIPFTSAFSQSRKELEKQRNELNKELEKKTNELNKTKKTKAANESELKALKSQMEERKKLISNLQTTIKENDQQLQKNKTDLQSLEAKEATLKEQYLKILRSEFLRKKSQSKWTYLLSSQNLNNLLLRWRYLNQFEKYALNKKEDLSKVKEEINNKNQEISQLKSSTTEKIALSTQNMLELQKEEKVKDGLVKQLSKQEADLTATIKKKEKQREKLNSEIEKIILAALSKTKSNESSASKNNLEIDNTEFSKNKGRLPWPVVNGKITGKFGTHPHPTLSNIDVSNNGIDITVNDKSQVTCIFDGEVVGVTEIPGFNTMVIIKHGSYYSVYSKLGGSSVKKGDKIKRGQNIGYLKQDDQGEIQLHFELWKDKTKLNPELWLK